MKRFRLRFALFFFLAATLAAGEKPAESGLVDYALVITGGELLQGVYPDAHAPFITRALLPLGCRCVSIVTVDDRAADMREALRFSAGKASLVIVTGGLGPTPNDITRETLSGFTGIPLKEQPEVLARMAQRFGVPAEKLRANMRRQTLVPASGGYLGNGNGSAVGLIFDRGDSVIVALPGPPRELQGMVRDELVPWLRDRYGVRIPGRARTLRFVGVGQSMITQTIEDHVTVPPDLIVTSLFEASRVDFTFSLPGKTEEAERELDRLEAQLREHLGDYYYADDGSSLETVILKALRERGGSLVLAEIGSAGYLATAFRTADDSSALLAGAYVAPAEEAMARLLRIPSGEPIAAAAATSTGSQWAIATGPVETGAGGKMEIAVTFLSPGEGRHTARIPVGSRDGRIAYDNLVTAILDEFRRLLRAE